MPSEQENDILMQTGRGTRMGELMRRYWHPIAAEEKGGLLWAYLGPSPAPLVPDWGPFSWQDGVVQLVFTEIPCHPLWTMGRTCLWPNALYTGDHFEWRVPVNPSKFPDDVWLDLDGDYVNVRSGMLEGEDQQGG